MNSKSLTIALALAAGIGAQAQETVDATARNQATQASQAAAKATTEAAAAEAQAKAATDANGAQNEKIDATAGKLSGLEEAYLETKSTVAGLAKLKVGGFVQFQYAYAEDTSFSGGYSQKQGAWSMRRARIKFTYDAGNGALAVWQPNFLESKFETKDAYFQYTEQYLKSIWIRGGIQDIPFGYEIGYSSSAIENIERSRFEKNAIFKDEKDLGVVAGFNSDNIPWVNLKAGWMNGNAPNSVQNDWSAQQDPKNFVGRAGFAVPLEDIGISIDGGASYYYDSKLLTDATKKPGADSTNVAMNGYYTTFQNDSMVKVYGSFRKDMNTNVLGLDAQLYADVPNFGGVKVLGEYYNGKIVGAVGGLTRYSGAASLSADVRNATGYNVSLILNPVVYLPQLQLVYRYDYFDPNTDVSGDGIDANKGFSGTDIAYTTNTLGLNWFINGNLKVCLFYDLVANETTSNPNMNGHVNVNAGKKDAAGKALPASYTGAYTAAKDFTGDVADNVLTLRFQMAY